MTLAAAGAVALGAAPLGAIFEEWRWIWYAWVAIAAVAGAHLLARAARLPSVLVPVAGAAGLLVYLTAVFSPDGALLGLIPTPDSLDRLWSGLAEGMADVNDYAAPVPATDALILLTAASLGATAIVVDVIAVTLRKPAAAGLALLALYAVPTAVVLAGVPWILFAIAAFGYLMLLMVEGRDRLLHWGRPVAAPGPQEGPSQADPDADTPSPLTGQRIGAAAIALAVILPLLVPGMTGNALNRLTGDSGDGTGTGSGPLNEFAALRGELRRSDPVEVMRVNFNDGKPTYLRMKVLDIYNRGGFSRSRIRSSQFDIDGEQLRDLNTGAVLGRPYTTNIQLTDNFIDDHLPVHYVPTRIDDIGDGWSWDLDRAVVVSGDQVSNFRYTVQGTIPEPTVSQLEEVLPLPSDTGDFRRELALPNSIPTAVQTTVDSVTKGLSSPYEQARAINDYFTDGKQGFTYSETTLGNGNDVLADFLKNKQGYCEQYAAAMAIMLRLRDIPSRVVVGYTPGNPAENGERSVTTNDAHAWVEAYFAGIGWTWFDPTPLGEGRAAPPDYAPRPQASQAPTATASGAAAPTAGPTANQLPQEDLEAGSSGDGADQGGVITPQRLLVAGTGLAVLLLLLLPALLRLGSRRRRLRTAGGDDPGAAARAAWDEVVGTAADYGVPVRASETPRALARRLRQDLNLDTEASNGLRLVALAEERARYAARPGVPGDLARAVREVRRGLRGGSSPRRRWRATLLPPSTLRAARSGSAVRAASASASMTRLGEAVRRPVTPRRR